MTRTGHNNFFTKREIQVLTLSAQGKTYHEIACFLSITEDTAKDHMEHAREKLNAVNKTHAIALAVSGGYIQPHHETPGDYIVSGKK